ncbi:MAG: hypothetical protein HOC70_17285 [Gammaproteobacteria bacterium]|jgi:hypothetical protein|nr:hypothetical protein [Gammaproteobacteria bacterium]
MRVDGAFNLRDLAMAPGESGIPVRSGTIDSELGGLRCYLTETAGVSDSELVAVRENLLD